MEYDVAAIELVFNMFRLKHLDELLPQAAEKDVGVIARVPLASGLLTGRYTADTVFGPKDHRSCNREGASFDKGETFSGVPYELGLEAVGALDERPHGRVDKLLRVAGGQWPPLQYGGGNR